MQGKAQTSRSHRERRDFILERLREDGQVDVSDVAEALEVSTMTVRRDLASLDEAGLLRRVHGGATVRPSRATRSGTMVPEKLRIARAVRSLVGSGETIGVDSGTTCTAVAHQLAEVDDILAVTYSLPAAMEFQESRSRMLVLGGIVTPEATLVSGGGLENLHLDKLVLGCGGISSTHGVSYFDMAETDVRRAMLRISDAVVLAADHTKFERRKAIILGSLDIIDILVTSALPPDELRVALDDASVEVIVASD